jgi:hypothetical protein
LGHGAKCAKCHPALKQDGRPPRLSIHSQALVFLALLSSGSLLRKQETHRPPRR